jgi:YidC/Oxa1 family membrane protein insertase
MADDQQMQQQKMMLYIMPVFLTFLGFNLPVGVLVYWVTTNLWQMGQQWFMLREVEHSAPPAKDTAKAARSKDAKRPQHSKDTKAARSKDAKKPSPSKNTAAGPKDTGKAADKAAGRGKKGGSPSSKTLKGKDTGADGRKVSKNGAIRNGHQTSGPNKISKQHDETGDKRR